MVLSFYYVRCPKCFGSERWGHVAKVTQLTNGEGRIKMQAARLSAHAPKHCPLFPGKCLSWVRGLRYNIQYLWPSFLGENPVLAGGPGTSSWCFQSPGKAQKPLLRWHQVHDVWQSLSKQVVADGEFSLEQVGKQNWTIMVHRTQLCPQASMRLMIVRWWCLTLCS